jgi:uncharacterized protein GlcG (DUF336 family)
VALGQPGTPQASVRDLPGAVVLGGGIMVQSGGSLVERDQVSGARASDADDACAKGRHCDNQDKLDF